MTHTPSCRARPGIHRSTLIVAGIDAQTWMPGRARHDEGGRC